MSSSPRIWSRVAENVCPHGLFVGGASPLLCVRGGVPATDVQRVRLFLTRLSSSLRISPAADTSRKTKTTSSHVLTCNSVHVFCAADGRSYLILQSVLRVKMRKKTRKVCRRRDENDEERRYFLRTKKKEKKTRKSDFSKGKDR